MSRNDCRSGTRTPARSASTSGYGSVDRRCAARARTSAPARACPRCAGAARPWAACASPWVSGTGPDHPSWSPHEPMEADPGGTPETKITAIMLYAPCTPPHQPTVSPAAVKGARSQAPGARVTRPGLPRLIARRWECRFGRRAPPRSLLRPVWSRRQSAKHYSTGALAPGRAPCGRGR